MQLSDCLKELRLLPNIREYFNKFIENELNISEIENYYIEKYTPGWNGRDQEHFEKIFIITKAKLWVFEFEDFKASSEYYNLSDVFKIKKELEFNKSHFKTPKNIDNFIEENFPFEKIEIKIIFNLKKSEEKYLSFSLDQDTTSLEYIKENSLESFYKVLKEKTNK